MSTRKIDQKMKLCFLKFLKCSHFVDDTKYIIKTAHLKYEKESGMSVKILILDYGQMLYLAQ